MANVKNGAYREIIIDRCLQSRRGYSTQEILDKCNRALERRGDPPITASNTIRNDILSIENRWHVTVEPVKNGRNVRYRYQDPEFSIFNSPLNEFEIEQLTQAVSVLRRFEGMPGFEWVDELNAHLQYTVNTKKPVVGFDENTLLQGMEYFTPLFNAINDRQTLSITYRTYKDDKEMEDVIHPYYLKEYNQRWFLFGLNDNLRRITTFALDRIESIDRAAVKYIVNTSFDFKKYFDNIVGVSFLPDCAVEEVKLWVDKEQLPYTLSKPIHRSQEIVEEREDGSAIISIHVMPNFELTQLLLSFGEKVLVLSPEHLKQEIIGRIEKNLKNYQSVHLD